VRVLYTIKRNTSDTNEIDILCSTFFYSGLTLESDSISCKLEAIIGLMWTKMKFSLRVS